MASEDTHSASLDPEKGAPVAPLPPSSHQFANDSLSHDAILDIDEPTPSNKFLQWSRRVERLLQIEARGIHHVKASDQSPKTTLSFLQIVILWFSINTASQNITLASIGQAFFGLGFVDATLCSILGAIVGTIPVAYTATWGPWSGNRTMVGDAC
jgi:hypothetical protein